MRRGSFWGAGVESANSCVGRTEGEGGEESDCDIETQKGKSLSVNEEQKKMYKKNA